MALIDNIYSYYKMDEASGGALDATGNGRTLANFGTAIGTASGIITTSRDFVGTGGTTLTRAPNTTDFFCGANPFSFSFWVRFRGFPVFNDVGLCNRYEPFGQREYIVFFRSGDHKIVFNIESGAANASIAWSSAAALNTWYHVTGGWDGANIKLSINAATFITAAYATPMVNGGDSFKLGFEAESLNGQMDEFGFWMGRCITQTEVTQLYNNGAGLDFGSFGTVVPPPNVWNSDGTPNGGPNSIQVLHNATACHDGDTITIPAGTFIWTSGVALTKAITLQGQTTIIGDHTNFSTTPNQPPGLVANDLTRIVDGVTTGTTRLITMVNSSTTATMRVTGITMTSDPAIGGHSNTVNAQIIDVGTTINPLGKRHRIDHCHFYTIARGPGFGIFAHGVMDHCLIRPIPNNNFGEFRINNRVGNYGDEEFATDAKWGTDLFWFFEDCYWDNSILGNRNSAGGTDRETGGKLVIRYCYMRDLEVVCHATGSAGRRRGGRAGEEYNNIYEYDLNGNGGAGSMDGFGSGSALYHDNTFTGPVIRSGWAMNNYRSFSVTSTSFGGAGGQNPLDINVTRADGTHVDGEPPFMFYSGTVTAYVNNLPGGLQKITVAGTPWTVNQWVGYTVVTPSTAGRTNTIGQIDSNTANELTCEWYSIGQNTFPVGSSIGIYKLFGPALDQPGMGQGDLFAQTDPPTPTVWPHQQVEAAYSWNNVHIPSGTHINVIEGANASNIETQGLHYFIDTPKPGYTPFTYPHPLVSSVPVVTRIIALSGIPSLVFGNVTIGGASPTALLRVSNTGNATLTVTGVTYPSGFTGATTGFTVPSASFFDITVTFTPLLPQLYSGVITVNSDATSGTATIVASGTGVNPAPLPPQGHRKQARDAFQF